jgi:NADPH-dependent 2,4-dienoyl-CoA reductase/sulfur reductase-like enzyme
MFFEFGVTTLYYDFVVVGGGVGGGEASVRLARFFNKPTLLISDYPLVYSKMTLSYGLKQGVKTVDPYVVYTPEDLRGRGVTFIHDRVVAVEPDKNTVVLGSGERVEYGVLVLATGSKARVLDVDGVGLKGVFTFRTFTDMLELSSIAEPGRRALVVGTGTIGLLVSDALSARGVKVYAVDILPLPGLTAVEEPLARIILNKMKLKSVEFMGGVTVEKLRGDWRVEEAILTNGERLQVDFVVFSVGVAPNIPQGLEGLVKSREGALLIDNLFRTSRRDIYAIGDCATTMDLQTGESIYRPLGIIASYAAKLLPKSMEGVGYQGFLAYQVQEAFSMLFIRVGLNGLEARRLGVSYSYALVELKVPGVGVTRNLVVYEKGSGRLLGWQSVGGYMASYKSKVFEHMIRSGMRLEDLEEKGFKVLE